MVIVLQETPVVAMSKAVEDVAHFSKEGEDQKLVKGMEHAKVCHVLSYIYHCNKNLIQPN